MGLGDRISQQIESKIFDNAMFYKDFILQTRGKSFVAEIYILLGLCMALTWFFFIFLLPILPAGSTGPTFFWSLVILQSLFMLVIVSRGHTSAANEFRNETNEMTDLAGLSVEKTVLGRMLFMCAQFLRSFSCLAPFMVYSISLGGLDLLTFCVTIVLIPIAAVPLFLLGIWTGLSTRPKDVKEKKKHAAPARLIFTIFFLLFILPNMIGVLFTRGVGGFVVSSVPAVVSNSPSAAFLFVLAPYFAAYILFCLLLFFFCCGALCHAADSRSTSQKIIIYLLMLLWMGLLISSGLLRPIHVESFCLQATIPLFIATCLMGLVFFYGRPETPAMSEARSRDARGLARLVYYWFLPGAMGARRSILLICATVLVFGIAIWGLSDRSLNDAWTIARHMGIVLQAPFFIAFPVGLLAYMRPFRERHHSLRHHAIAWWIGAGVILAISVLVLDEFWPQEVLIGAMTGAAAIALSPISTYMVPYVYDMGAVEPVFRFILAGLGVWLLFRVSGQYAKTRWCAGGGGGGGGGGGASRQNAK